MLKHLLISILLWVDVIWSIPLHQRSDLGGSHIVILTPQAQVHFEPLSGTSYLQHLTSLGRYAAPHDDTVLYIPAGGAGGGAAPYILSTAVGSAAGVKSVPAFYQARHQFDPDQVAQAQATAQQVVAAVQSGNFTEAATIINQATQAAAATAASQAAGAAQEALAGASGLYPVLQSSNDPIAQITNVINQISAASSAAATGTPAASNAIGGGGDTESNKFDRIEYEIPIRPLNAIGPVLNKEPRHHYFITPGPIPQIVDLIHAPVVYSAAGGVPTIRARSLELNRPEMTPIIALPLMKNELQKPEALPLQSSAQRLDSKLAEQKEPDFKPSLVENVFKEDPLKEEFKGTEKLPQKEVLKPALDMELKEKITTLRPKLKTVVAEASEGSGGGGGVGVVGVVGSGVGGGDIVGAVGSGGGGGGGSDDVSVGSAPNVGVVDYSVHGRVI